MPRSRVAPPHDPGGIPPTVNQAIIAQLSLARVSPSAEKVTHSRQRSEVAITDRHDSTNEDGAISRRVEALGRQVQQHRHVIKRIESTDGIAHFDDLVGEVSVDSGEHC